MADDQVRCGSGAFVAWVLVVVFLATVFWLLATAGFGWYVRHLANYNVLYGSVGTSIALLVWMYLMSLIALLGCEFNAEFERETQLAYRKRIELRA